MVKIRPLQQSDMLEAIQLLRDNLSPFEPPPEEYERIWTEFSAQPNVHGVVVCDGDRIVGYGSVVIETKIRGGRLAHVEDICASAVVRRKGVGSMLLDELLQIAKQHGCYKVVLSCQLNNVPFYAANQYRQDGVSMVQFSG